MLIGKEARGLAPDGECCSSLRSRSTHRRTFGPDWMGSAKRLRQDSFAWERILKEIDVTDRAVRHWIKWGSNASSRTAADSRTGHLARSRVPAAQGRVGGVALCVEARVVLDSFLALPPHGDS